MKINLKYIIFFIIQKDTKNEKSTKSINIKNIYNKIIQV